MITEDQFQTQWEKLEASFGITKPTKLMARWYDEFHEMCEYQPFVETMKRLQYGQKFPNFAMFKAEYRSCSPESFRKAEKSNTCGYCENGVVLYRLVVKPWGVRDRAANCGACSRNKLKMSTVDPRRLVQDKFGEYRTKDAVEIDRANDIRLNSTRDERKGEITPQNIKEVVGQEFGEKKPGNEELRRKSISAQQARDDIEFAKHQQFIGEGL